LLLLVLCFGSIRFIITLEQAFHTQAKLYLLFEFMHGGDLYITAQGRPDQKYTEEEVRMRRRPAHLPLLVIRTHVVPSAPAPHKFDTTIHSLRCCRLYGLLQALFIIAEVTLALVRSQCNPGDFLQKYRPYRDEANASNRITK
jgi:hypothetical protein